MNCAPVCKRVHKRRASRGKIESPDSFGAQFVLHQASRGRKKHVRRDGRDDDHFDIGGDQAALLQGFLGGFGGEIAGSNAFIDEVAFADPGAFHDPLVVGFDHFFQIGIGQKPRRDISSEGADFCADELAQ